jgi:hypothetical protein
VGAYFDKNFGIELKPVLERNGLLFSDPLHLTLYALRLRVCAMFTRRSLGVGGRYLSSVVPQGGT